MGGILRSRFRAARQVLDTVAYPHGFAEQARALNRQNIWVTLGAGLLALLFVGSEYVSLAMVLAVLIAGLPLARLAFYLAELLVASPRRLRLRGFVIGKKVYDVAADQRGLLGVYYGDKLVPGDTLRDMTPFLVATEHVSHATPLNENLYEDIIEGREHIYADLLPDLTVEIRRYGPSRQWYAFVYGSLEAVLAQSSDIWDMGHVRGIRQGDLDALEAMQKAWRTESAFQVAFAYAALPSSAKPNQLTAADLENSLNFLGFAKLDSRRELNRAFTPNTALNHSDMLISSVAANYVLLATALFSVIGAAWLQAPPALTIAHVLLLKIAAESLALAGTAWDRVHNKLTTSGLVQRLKHARTDLLWMGLYGGALTYGNFWLLMSLGGFSPNDVEAGSALHLQAVSLVLITATFSIWAFINTERGDTSLSAYHTHNIFFGLALAIGLLIIIGTIYLPGLNKSFGTAPLELTELIFGLGGAMLFAGIRWTQIAFRKNHTREQILDILKQS